MKTPITEDQRQFIIKTLLPYKENKKLCAIARLPETGKKVCAYLTDKGNKCAVGQHMKEGEWQKFRGDYYGLVDRYKPEEFLTEEALKQDFDNYTWKMIQWYHDCLATREYIGSAVYNLEEATGVQFPELK